jgi:hypothetical protein
MSQRDFIDNNRRSPDLVNLTEAYLNEVKTGTRRPTCRCGGDA